MGDFFRSRRYPVLAALPIDRVRALALQAEAEGDREALDRIGRELSRRVGAGGEPIAERRPGRLGARQDAR